MKNRTIIALDLAKRVIQVAKFSSYGEVIFNKAMTPKALKEMLANQKECIVAMEGCGSFQYWSRIAFECGHEVRAMPPGKVAPYISRQKTDANDAVGIYIACQQPNMTFCQVKTIDQLNIQSIESSRKFIKKTLISTSNHIIALFYEYGITFGKGKKALETAIATHLAPESDALPSPVKQTLSLLWQQYSDTSTQLDNLEQQLSSQVKETEPCTRLMALEGVGKTGAAALYAALGDGSGFKNGRNASAFIGATPKQHSSGGIVKMKGIDKHGGDKPLRSLLFTGALSYITRLPSEPTTQKQQWLIELVRRAGVKRACIALVNKTIRTAWALLRYQKEYEVKTLAN